MASTKFANYIVDARGKIAGTIYSRNGGGSYARGSFSPTNPQTGKQIAQRMRVKSIQSKWKQLNQSQRDTWINAAPEFPVTNRVGSTVVLSGHQLFLRLNLNIRKAPSIGTFLVTPPVKARFPVALYSITVLDNTGAALTATIVRTISINGSAITGFRSIVYATKPLTPGAFSPSPAKYKKITDVAGITSSLSVGAAYVTTFGLPPVGSQIFFRIELLHTITGMIQHMFTGSALVV